MIPKEDADRVARETYEAAAKELEEKIDAAIRTNKGGQIYVDAGGVPRPAAEAMVEKYNKGGWTARYYANQHDGAVFTLS